MSLTLKTLSDVALLQFCCLYNEVMQEQGVKDAPSQNDMFKLMNAKILNELPPNGSRDDFVQPVVAANSSQNSSLPGSVEEDACVPVAAVNTSTTQPFVASSNQVVTSFDLRKANKEGAFNFNVEGSDAPANTDAWDPAIV